jgi:hypothetical protein
MGPAEVSGTLAARFTPGNRARARSEAKAAKCTLGVNLTSAGRLAGTRREFGKKAAHPTALRSQGVNLAGRVRGTGVESAESVGAQSPVAGVAGGATSLRSVG